MATSYTTDRIFNRNVASSFPTPVTIHTANTPNSIKEFLMLEQFNIMEKKKKEQKFRICLMQSAYMHERVHTCVYAANERRCMLKMVM